MNEWIVKFFEGNSNCGNKCINEWMEINEGKINGVKEGLKEEKNEGVNEGRKNMKEKI